MNKSSVKLFAIPGVLQEATVHLVIKVIGALQDTPQRAHLAPLESQGLQAQRDFQEMGDGLAFPALSDQEGLLGPMDKRVCRVHLAPLKY